MSLQCGKLHYNALFRGDTRTAPCHANMPYERELETALEAAETAAKVVLEAYQRFEVVPDVPASITTDADRQAQEIILAGFATSRPTRCVPKNRPPRSPMCHTPGRDCGSSIRLTARAVSPGKMASSRS